MTDDENHQGLYSNVESFTKDHHYVYCLNYDGKWPWDNDAVYVGGVSQHLLNTHKASKTLADYVGGDEDKAQGTSGETTSSDDVSNIDEQGGKKKKIVKKKSPGTGDESNMALYIVAAVAAAGIAATSITLGTKKRNSRR